MGKGKIGKEKRMKIIADYVQTGENASETARRNRVSRSTVRRIVSGQPEVTELATEKNKEAVRGMMQYLNANAQKAQAIIGSGLDALAADGAFAGRNPRDTATAIAIVMDKFSEVEARDEQEERPYYMDGVLIADGFAPVRRDILEHRHTEYILPGGRGSTKSSFVSLMLIELMKRYPDMHVLVVRQVAETLRDSVHAQLEWAIQAHGLAHEFTINKSPLNITLKATGQKIYFRGGDDPVKIKSIKPPFGSIRAVWFEELDQFKGEAQIRNIEQSALRGETRQDVGGWIFKSFNPPRVKSHWANKYAGRAGRASLVYHTTYETAMVPKAWLGSIFFELAGQLRTENFDTWRHEYGGEAIGLGGMVFENIVRRELSDSDIAVYDRIHNGVDWGWFPDPFAFNRVQYNPAQRELIIFDEYHATKMSNAETAQEVLSRIGDQAVTCDSAEPKSISDWRAAGVIAQGARKGPDSVRYSIKWLASLARIVIDPVRCPNTFAEFTGAEYRQDVSGDYTSEIESKDDHHIDAVRYATERIWRRRGL